MEFNLGQSCNIHISVAWQLLSSQGECVRCKQQRQTLEICCLPQMAQPFLEIQDKLNHTSHLYVNTSSPRWKPEFHIPSSDCQGVSGQCTSADLLHCAWLCQDLENNQGLSLTSQPAVFHSFLKMYLSKLFYKHYLSPVAFVSHVTTQILNVSSINSNSFRLPVCWQLLSSCLFVFKAKIKMLNNIYLQNLCLITGVHWWQPGSCHSFFLCYNADLVRVTRGTRNFLYL